jgi:uncharacterized protein YjbI with pentapeptide repeats
MNLYANRLLVEEGAACGPMEDCCIEGCDLSGFQPRRARWKKVTLRDVCANRAEFHGASLEDCSFFRCGLSHAVFRDSVMRNAVLDGIVLIRSLWLGGKLSGSAIRSSCMQRAELRRMRVCSSAFADFEAIQSVLEDCVFSGVRFALSYGSGMNGFCGARIRNCIFYNCRFEGFPLRGASLENCLFVASSGETGREDSVCRLSSPEPLVRREEAFALVKHFREETMREEEIKSVLGEMDRTAVIEAFALLLAEGGPPPGETEKDIPRFSNFAQALLYLKKNYDFEELSLFTTEADLVYVGVSGRRILLTDFPVLERRRAEGLSPAPAGKSPGRFSHLEM